MTVSSRRPSPGGFLRHEENQFFGARPHARECCTPREAGAPHRRRRGRDRHRCLAARSPPPQPMPDIRVAHRRMRCLLIRSNDCHRFFALADVETRRHTMQTFTSARRDGGAPSASEQNMRQKKRQTKAIRSLRLLGKILLRHATGRAGLVRHTRANMS